MKYSKEFKDNILKKIYSGSKVNDVAREINIPFSTIHSWIQKKTKSSQIPSNFSLYKKYNLLLESKKINDDNIGEWLRTNGVHSDHLIKWEKEIGTEMTNSKIKEENKSLKDELKKTKRELVKKDKALAEAAALLILKKKYQYLWEEEDQ